MTRSWLLVALALVAGCTDDENPERLLDTGWFEADTDDYSACGQRVENTVPTEGDSWFWRDPLTLFLASDTVPLEVRLTTFGGKEVETTLTPNDAGLIVTVGFEGGLEPDTTYVLTYSDCAGPHEVSFSTTSWGTPLEEGVASIRGRTFHLDLPGATWVEPGGFGPFLASNFEAPILLGVQYADDTFLDLFGGQGYFFVGSINQDNDFPTWELPISDFTSAPYFETAADEVQLSISNFALPILDFELSGTFAADGSGFAGGVLAGLGDTRFAGGALNQPNNPAAFCELAGGLGVSCEACPDGEPYCLQVRLENLEAEVVPDLVLTPIYP